jgi:hypothetical protein
MLLWLIRSLKFWRIQMKKVLDTEHGGLYHWKAVRFSKGLPRGLYPLA